MTRIAIIPIPKSRSGKLDAKVLIRLLEGAREANSYTSGTGVKMYRTTYVNVTDQGIGVWV